MVLSSLHYVSSWILESEHTLLPIAVACIADVAHQ
jgi:hypothetical protein